MSVGKNTGRLAWAALFLGPNLLGFLAFTLFPLGFSLWMAFTNFDLRLHNMFRSGAPTFVGFDHFLRLAHDRDFWKYLGNTLYLLLGLPFAIAGSLGAAVLLNGEIHETSGRRAGLMIAGFILLVSCVFLACQGLGGAAMVLLLGGVAVLFFSTGLALGNVVHRTLFYTPHFTSGVATFLVWKKLYNPDTGPINRFLQPSLDFLQRIVLTTPAQLWKVLAWLIFAAGVAFVVQQLVRLWKDGLGVRKCLTFLMLSGVGLYLLARVGLLLAGLPETAASGLSAPQWLTDYQWAKPALILMGLWAAVGSNNMLLYLAGLSEIPKELYEAADIDGASRWQRFWHVTWPQLMPVTFFIVTVSLIYGLQGGFEMARTMTQGGPAGSTTTLSYYIYTEAFDAGRLGYAAAVSWILFFLVFAVTAMNWRLGKAANGDE